MHPFRTDRLTIREATLADAAFAYQLMNTEGWLTHIGDRNINTLENARDYIQNSLIASYRKHGFGLWIMELARDGRAIGLCGLLQRENLENPDVGFAILPEFQRQGFTFEASMGVLNIARDKNIPVLYGITNETNTNSQGLLEKIGMHLTGTTAIGEKSDLLLFKMDLHLT